MNEVYLLLGSNMGNPERNLNLAKEFIDGKLGKIFIASSLYQTEPWGFKDNNFFLNQVVGLKTGIKPQELIKSILEIEEKMGRIRSGKGYESRKIDIDILYYGYQVVNADDLVIPHPRLHERKFTLVPLAEIAPDFFHPILKKSNPELLASCQDSSEVHIFAPQIIHKR